LLLLEKCLRKGLHTAVPLYAVGWRWSYLENALTSRICSLYERIISLFDGSQSTVVASRLQTRSINPALLIAWKLMRSENLR
jgi:hypothetical protein